VQPMALGQHRIDERLAEVDPSAARLEHPLDQFLHLEVVRRGVGQLVPAAAGDEHPGRVVDLELSPRR